MRFKIKAKSSQKILKTQNLLFTQNNLEAFNLSACFHIQTYLTEGMLVPNHYQP